VRADAGARSIAHRRELGAHMSRACFFVCTFLASDGAHRGIRARAGVGAAVDVAESVRGDAVCVRVVAFGVLWLCPLALVRVGVA